MEATVTRDGEACRLVRLVPRSKRPADSFVCFSWDSLNQLHEAFPRNAQTVAVFGCVLNACRSRKSPRIIFRPAWYKRLKISTRTIHRCLNRLEDAGLLRQEKRRGQSPVVTLAEHVSYDLRVRRR